MVEIDFLAANHARIVGLYESLSPKYVVKYLTTVDCMDHATTVHAWRGLPWALASGHWALATLAQFTVYRLRHSCPTARTAARPIPEGMTIFVWLVLRLGQYGRPCQQQLGFLFTHHVRRF